MVDQEGGLVKRLGGRRRRASARADGRGGGDVEPRAGRSHGGQPARGRGQRRPGPVLDVARPGGTIADTERGFGSTAAAVEATAVPFADGLQCRRRCGYRQALSRPRRERPKTPTSPCSAIDLSKQTLRAVDERPYRRFVAAGGAGW